FYGGTPIGISAIFSVATQIDHIPIRSLYSTRDLPDYASYRSDSCPLCQQGVAVDAICNGFGYSTIN
ncbi:MAG: orotate phosphoribosyltransferase, partial [Lachnospiraceae bacterium]|nr:orotate phosphoribosyltransferase [Lachnospiraceae bacterium]